MALNDDILTILLDYSAGYKRMHALISGRTFNNERQNSYEENKRTLYLTLARLKKQRLVMKKNEVWKITDQGKNYLKNKLRLFLPTHNKSRVITKREKSMVIAFDIPEHYRRKRDWLRVELRLLSFSPIQKSVWFGPAPLPKQFINNLHELQLLKHIKFFEAKEKDIINL